MIGRALSYPVATGAGRRHLAMVTGSLLAAAVALRIAGTLYPSLLLVGPLLAAGLALVLAAGVCAHTLTAPTADLPGLPDLLRAGARATGIGCVVMLGPLVLLGWTALSYTDSEAALESGAPMFFLLGSTMALVAFLAATYLTPVLLARGTTLPLRDAFNRRRVVVALSAVAYLQGWAAGLPLVVLGWTIAVGGVATTTNLGGLFAIVTGCYCLLAGTHAIGRGYVATPGSTVEQADGER